MAERHIIDMETWSRRGHYRYFGKLVPHEDRLLMTVSVVWNLPFVPDFFVFNWLKYITLYFIVGLGLWLCLRTSLWGVLFCTIGPSRMAVRAAPSGRVRLRGLSAPTRANHPNPS